MSVFPSVQPKDQMGAVAEIVLWTVIWAVSATAICLVLGIPVGYVLARYRFPGCRVLASVASLPLVLPPTAVGYLLLTLLGDSGPLGFLDILLTGQAVVIACTVMSFPLVLRTVRVSFESVDPKLEAVSRTLGRGRGATFVTVTLPLAVRGLLAAAILGFTRAMGEFGATILIAGNIPGQTQTLASAIYSAQQAGNAEAGFLLLSVALLVGFTAVFSSELLAPRREVGSR